MTVTGDVGHCKRKPPVYRAASMRRCDSFPARRQWLTAYEYFIRVQAMRQWTIYRRLPGRITPPHIRLYICFDGDADLSYDCQSVGCDVIRHTRYSDTASSVDLNPIIFWIWPWEPAGIFAWGNYIPALMFGMEACPLKKRDINSLDFVVNRLFMKLLKKLQTLTS